MNSRSPLSELLIYSETLQPLVIFRGVWLAVLIPHASKPIVSLPHANYVDSRFSISLINGSFFFQLLDPGHLINYQQGHGKFVTYHNSIGIVVDLRMSDGSLSS